MGCAAAIAVALLCSTPVPTAQVADAAAGSPTASAPRPDRWWDGAVLGAGIGGGLGLIGDYYDDCEECHDVLYGSIAYGAGIGALVDWLWRDRRAGSGRTATPQRRWALPVAVAAGPRRVAVHARFDWPRRR